MNVALAQIKGFLGDFRETRKRMLQLIDSAHGKADFILFPEGGLFGYPPTDFIRNPNFINKQNQEIKKIQSRIPKNLNVLLGGFFSEGSDIFNGALLLQKGKPPLFFKKEFLSNGDVFRESRYFARGSLEKNFFQWKGTRIQILICEDIFQNPQFSKPDVLFCLNSSPYTENKPRQRLRILKGLSRKHKCPAVYVNRVGGQNGLIFDGGSFAVSATGALKKQCRIFEPDFQIISLLSQNRKALSTPLPPLQEQKEKALVLGLQDFCRQTGFKKVHLGLSGGMDSALVCYLAVQAMGAKNVTGLFLPGPYTISQSFKIVKSLQKTIGFSLKELSITSLYRKSVKEFFSSKLPLSVTDQNLQARLRMLCLMAHSNENQSLLLGTSNKSEMATGYATLYGDLSGGLMPIGDLLKTEVYKLCRAINKKHPIFSKELLSRPPSAELKPHQTDQQDLPDYKTLDLIIKHLMNHKSPRSDVEKAIEKKLRASEFKRKQAPPILKISESSFGEEWKFPIAHRFPIC